MAALPSDLSDVIAVLPLGATEQHGPHLPPETDAIIAEAMAGRLVEAGAAQDLRLFALPVESIGYSPEHLDYPGSLSLSYGEAIERWIGIGADLSARGLRKLMLLNAHGGNSPLMTIVATELRIRHDLLCVATSWTRFGAAQGLFEESEIALGIHAGAIETSVMLALRPDLVRLEALADFPNSQADLERRFQYLRAYGRHAFGWKMQDLNRQGAVGNARLANAEKGESMIERAVRGLVQLACELKEFEIMQLTKN